MPLNANEEALVRQPEENDVEYEHQRLVRAPKEDGKIGKWSWIALVLNRTFGSGIFLTPSRVLAGTGCVGGALLMWALACLISLCGIYVWLECGLSMPQRRVRGEAEPRGVPRSGGEKNFLEFMFPNASSRLPHLRTTCSFAIMYILLYNLGGNAIAFALEVLVASGHYEAGTVPPRGAVLGIAVGVLTLVIVLHTFSRGGGILINNAMAVVKVILLLVIFFLGVASATGRFGAPGNVVRNNFSKEIFDGRTDLSSWSNSLLLCTYAISGWRQPFYILAETKSPRKYFPKYTVIAWGLSSVLYMLVNIGYLLVVDKNLVLPQAPNGPSGSIDLVTLFFEHLFGDKAARAMAGVVAFSIFGTLWVMTFTASRIKQELAKEGIFPKSLYISASYKTPYALIRKWFSKQSLPENELEQAPTLAFAVHWTSSLLLIAAVSPIADPRKSYFLLVSLYAYSINTLVGCFVASGLLMLKLRKSKWHWQERRRYRPWLSPVHAIIYAVATAFIAITVFIPPTEGSPFTEAVNGLPYYLAPLIGVTAPLWGLLWYCGLLFYGWYSGRQLNVTREAYWMPDPNCPNEYLQQAEIIDVTWQITPRDDMSEDFTSLQDLKSSSVVRQRAIPGNDSFGNLEASRQSRDARGDGGGLVRDSRRLSDSFETVRGSEPDALSFSRATKGAYAY